MLWDLRHAATCLAYVNHGQTGLDRGSGSGRGVQVRVPGFLCIHVAGPGPRQPDTGQGPAGTRCYEPLVIFLPKLRDIFYGTA